MTRQIKLGGRIYDLVPCAACRKPMQHLPNSPFDRCFTCIAGPREKGEPVRDYRERALRAFDEYARRVRAQGVVRSLPRRAVTNEIAAEREGQARGVETVASPLLTRPGASAEAAGPEAPDSEDEAYLEELARCRGA